MRMITSCGEMDRHSCLSVCLSVCLMNLLLLLLLLLQLASVKDETHKP